MIETAVVLFGITVVLLLNRRFQGEDDNIDYQRDKVYAWTFGVAEAAEGLDSSPVRTSDGMMQIVKWCLSLYQINKPVQFDFNGRKNEYGSCHTTLKVPKFTFSPKGMMDVVAIHEAAHLIVHETYGHDRNNKQLTHHGARFVSIFINLIAKYAKLTVKSLEQSAELEGIHFIKTSDESP